MNSSDSKSLPLPLRVVVSMRAGAVLALANIVCVAIFAFAWQRVKTDVKSIQVTGSARKAIQSDLIVWSCKVSAIDPDLTSAYDTLKSSADKTIAFLTSRGINATQIKQSSIGTWKRRARDEKGNETEKIVAYELSQSIEVTSDDPRHVADVGQQVTALIKDGVSIESNPPTFIYTKMSDMKVTMLAEATKDATNRAAQIALSSGAKLGQILDAHMGVMQINPIHDYDVSGGGQNDTRSFDKEITAVVSTRFALE